MKYYKVLKDLPGGVYKGSILKVDNNVVISQNSKLYNSGYLSSTFLKEQDLQMTEYFEKSIGVSADNYVLFKGDEVYYEFEGQMVCGNVVDKVSDTDYYVKENVLINTLPKTWKDLKTISGYYISGDSDIYDTEEEATEFDANKNIFNTELQAKSALAYAQLSQLVANMNDGEEFDWDSYTQSKHCIVRDENELAVYNFGKAYRHLAFKTRELAEYSLKHHRQLWEAYYQIEE